MHPFSALRLHLLVILHSGFFKYPRSRRWDGWDGHRCQKAKQPKQPPHLAVASSHVSRGEAICGAQLHMFGWSFFLTKHFHTGAEKLRWKNTKKKSYITSCWCLLSLNIASALCHLDVVLHHMKFPSCTCPINFGASLNPTISMEMFRCGCDATSEVETEKGSMEKNTRAPHTALAADNF